MLEVLQPADGFESNRKKLGVNHDGLPRGDRNVLGAGHGNATRVAETALARSLELELPFLRRNARRWQRAHADVEDLVQDTLVRALASAHLWEPGTNLRAWLVTIMRNQFFTSVAQSGRASALHATVHCHVELPARNGQEVRLELRDLGSAIRRLPVKQRLAILLVAVEDRSYQEVAEAMQTSIGAVRCHLARGRLRLREMIYKTSDHSPFRTGDAGKAPPRTVRMCERS